MKRDYTEHVELVWYAPLRKYLPSALLLLIVGLLTSTFVFSHYSTAEGWEPGEIIVIITLYVGIVALAVYLALVTHRLQAAHDTHVRDTQMMADINERLDITLNHVGDGVIAADQDGNVTLLNKQAEALTGWTETVAIGSPLKKVFMIKGVQHVLFSSGSSAAVRVPGGAGTIRTEKSGTLMALDGTEREVDYEVVPMLDDHGWLVGTILTFRDITELRHAERQREALIAELSDTNKQLEEEIFKRERARKAALNLLQDAQQAQASLREREEHLRVLFEGIDDAILVYDQQGHILDCNHAACEQLKFTRDELLTRTVADVSIDHDEAWASPCFITSGGQTYPVDIRATSIHDHGQELTLAVARDITELKRIQNELRESIERLQESNQSLEEYARVASHDLQEPLRKIESFAKIVIEDYEPKLDKDGKHYLHIMSDAANRMRQLIKDVLAFSEAGASDRPKEFVDLNEVLALVQDNLSSRIKDKKAGVSIGKLPTIFGDRTAMIQLFQNFVSNALKFNQRKAPRVEVFAEEHVNEWDVLVKDNGIGMKEWEMRHIFAPFKRLHGRGAYEGTGIGLAVCRRIIHRHGGRVSVQSESGKGSVFRVTFPRTEPPSSTPVAEELEVAERMEG